MRLKQMSPILSFIDWRAHCLTWGLECKRVGCLVKVIRHWRLLCCVKYDACPGKQEARMILQMMHLEQERRIKDLSWKWSSGNLKKMLGCPHQSKEAYNTWRKPSISIPIHLNGSRLAGICSLGIKYIWFIWFYQHKGVVMASTSEGQPNTNQSCRHANVHWPTNVHYFSRSTNYSDPYQEGFSKGTEVMRK